MINKKAASNGLMWIIILAIAGVAIYFIFFNQPVATGELVRTASSISGGQFTLSYTVSRTGNWGASVEEIISGGCTISGKTSLKFVMVSDLPNPLTYTVTAPSGSTCTFTGNYQFGSEAIKNMPNLVKNT